MSLLEKFIVLVRVNKLFTTRDHLLLAVSGGIDSVVLCELCHQAGFPFSIAHCNFQLRGEESVRDEKMVIGLGEKYGVEVKLKKFDTERYASEKKLSIQEAARELRYSWFEELIESEKSKVKRQNQQEGNTSQPSMLNTQPSSPNIFLLTAHHADDNNETLLMNFFRGTGLHGLTGIPETNGSIRRPLLRFSKEELLTFARDYQLDYVEDSSNQSVKYTRNFFRNELIPSISKVYPQVSQNLQDNISRFKEAEKLYQYAVTELKKKLCRQKGAEVHIPVKQLLLINNRALIYEIIREYGFGEKQVDELIRLTASDSGKYIDAPGAPFRIIKHRHWLIISPVRAVTATILAIEKNVETAIFEAGELILKNAVYQGQPPPPAANEAWLDTSQLVYPLVLRKWKTGDYFYPLGMKKKKKLSRFFIDQKLSKSEKGNIWILESNKRIAWVIGWRIDDRFKLSGKSGSILKISFRPGH